MSDRDDLVARMKDGGEPIGWYNIRKQHFVNIVQVILPNPSGVLDTIRVYSRDAHETRELTLKFVEGVYGSRSERYYVESEARSEAERLANANDFLSALEVACNSMRVTHQGKAIDTKLSQYAAHLIAWGTSHPKE